MASVSGAHVTTLYFIYIFFLLSASYEHLHTGLSLKHAHCLAALHICCHLMF